MKIKTGSTVVEKDVTQNIGQLHESTVYEKLRAGFDVIERL